MVTTEGIRANSGIGTDGAALDVGNERSSINEAGDREMRRRWEKIKSYWERYQDVLSQTGMADTKEARETARWIGATQLTSRREIQDSIVWREEFFKGQGKDVIEKGLPLYRRFIKTLNEAKPYISKRSEHEWMKRLRDNSHMSFQGKQYWIDHQFPEYVNRWKKVAEERDTLSKDAKFKEIVGRHPDFPIILEREKFLDLHYNERVNRIAKAKAFLLALESGRSSLYDAAEKKLKGASSRHVLADHKIGMWLERIFKSKAKQEKIEEFVNGSGSTSLGQLIQRWTEVKFRFDTLKNKADKLDQDTAARGLTIMTEGQFLSMHYAQRLRYVQELDHRINGTQDINKEKPIFIRIRHAMDMKDWEDATELIGQATFMNLSEEERDRLRSMKQFVTQFKPKEKTSGSPADPEVLNARIDKIVAEIGEHHSEMQPMVLRLLKGSNANRSILQLRWMAYNERWTEGHGFCNYEIKKFGASKQHEEETRQRALRGEDVGRHNNIGHTTADQKFLRKTEVVRHKATFEHVNVKDGAATQEIAEWCEHEQHPRDLYWRTLCCHTDGEPKPSNWHDDWFKRLTELRSLTRSIKNAGYRYAGQGLPPEPLSGANTRSQSQKNASQTHFALAG